MIHFTDAALDSFIKEDVPSIDLTTALMGIGGRSGTLEFRSRESGVCACTEESARLMQKLGITVTRCIPSGTALEKDTLILSGTGTAEQLHMAWKVTLNMLEYCCGIAAHTHLLVNKARSVNKDISVAVTRKFMPGTKDLVIKSALAGGAFPHRLGLSETILVFKQHRVFLEHGSSLMETLKEMKLKAPEKKILVETEDFQEAAQLVDAGVDGVQFDKVSPESLHDWIPRLRNMGRPVTLIAAGGINLKNADLYAATQVDVLVTSSLFHGKPLDISAKMYGY